MEGLHSVNYIVTKRLQFVKIKLNARLYFGKNLTFKLIVGKIIKTIKLIDF